MLLTGNLRYLRNLRDFNTQINIGETYSVTQITRIFILLFTVIWPFYYFKSLYQTEKQPFMISQQDKQV